MTIDEKILDRKIRAKDFAWESELLQATISYKFSDEFIRNHVDVLDWFFVSKCQDLSESLLREFRHKIDWKAIDNTHSFSLEFIREFKKELDLKHRRLRKAIKNEFNKG